MHSAPPVLVPVGRFVWAGRIAGMLCLVTLLLGLAWATPASRMGVLLSWLALCALSAWCWRRETLPSGTLSWDGQSWWFQVAGSGGEAQEVTVRVVWDVQSALLVHVRGVAAAQRQRFSGFAWLQAVDMPGRWHGLRCAVHAAHTL